jgi:hypothetical protein
MIEVRRITRDDIDDLVAISLKELGEDYLDESDFIEALDNPDVLCNMVQVDGVNAGFAICKIFGPSDEPRMLGLPEGEDRDMVLECSRIGIIDSVAILDSMKGRGAGTRMCQVCYDDLVGMGCEMVCAMAWKSYTGRTNIAGILSGLGLEEHVSIQGYWNTQVDSPEGHHCPECGAPCRCYGVFWTRRV